MMNDADPDTLRAAGTQPAATPVLARPATDGHSAAAPMRDSTHQLILEIARALVDSPEQVVVEALERDENTILRLHVSQPDIGKVIGKQGRTAHSMRTILSAVSMKYHHRYTLDIVEGDAQRDGAEPPHSGSHTAKPLGA